MTQQKNIHLIKYLSKLSNEEVISALDNLINKGIIGKREYKQILKGVIKLKDEREANINNGI